MSRVPILVLAVLVAAVASSPAGATTVGGNTTSTNGPFVLAGGRIFLPTYVADSGLPDSGSTSTPGVSSFGAGNQYWSDHSLTDDGAGTPALASSGKAVAIAWFGPSSALRSALFRNGHVVAPVTHSTNDPIGGIDVGTSPQGARAAAWADSGGVHLQTVARDGTAASEVVLATDSADYVTVSPAAAGSWWVLWRTPSRLLARSVAAGGSMSPVRDLGPASETTGPHARFLDPAGQYAWRSAADGHGGAWVGLPRALLHLTPTRVSTVASSGQPVVLAAGGGRAALVSRSGRHNLRVRFLAPAGKRTVRLTGRAAAIDATVDAVTGKTYLLSSDAKENVRLTEITKTGKHRSLALPFCHRRRNGEVRAAGGLIAVACAGRYSENDSVYTGGDYAYGRNNLYVLMRGGKVLRRQTFFEGDYSY